MDSPRKCAFASRTGVSWFSCCESSLGSTGFNGPDGTEKLCICCPATMVPVVVVLGSIVVLASEAISAETCPNLASSPLVAAAFLPLGGTPVMTLTLAQPLRSSGGADAGPAETPFDADVEQYGARADGATFSGQC